MIHSVTNQPSYRYSDYAVRAEIQRRTASRRYDRWKKIQLSPQYSRVKRNAARKLNSKRAELGKQLKGAKKKLEADIANVVALLKPASSFSSLNIDELITRTRITLTELDEYIASLKRIRDEQDKAEQQAKEAAARAEEQKAAAAAMASESVSVQEQGPEISLQELKDQILELESKSCEILDLHEGNLNKFRDPAFIEEALEEEENEDLEELEERIEETGRRLAHQGVEIGQLHAQVFSPERKKQEEAMQKRQERNAQLKEKVLSSLATCQLYLLNNTCSWWPNWLQWIKLPWTGGKRSPHSLIQSETSTIAQNALIHMLRLSYPISNA